jgi:uncharacterized protein
MNNFNKNKETLINMFFHLRQKGFDLGIGELLAAIEAANEEQFIDSNELLQLAKLIWCKSLEQRTLFDLIWEDLSNALSIEKPFEEIKDLTPVKKQPKRQPKLKPQAQHNTKIEEIAPISTTETYIPDWKVLPICALETSSLPDSQFELNSYWPLSRRSMTNNWRYLRHLVADGSADILDVATTIKNFSLQGFFLAPAYQRRKRNNAHLLLFIDQEGSMEPLHHFTSDLVETAYESIHQVETFYFHNNIASYVYLNPHMTKSVELAQILRECSSNSSILIVSDAGAARGYRDFKRIEMTNATLYKFKCVTSLIAWLNPIPKERWVYSSAEIIEKLVPMFEADHDGFSKTLDVLRGQQVSKN